MLGTAEMKTVCMERAKIPLCLNTQQHVPSLICQADVNWQKAEVTESRAAQGGNVCDEEANNRCLSVTASVHVIVHSNA